MKKLAVMAIRVDNPLKKRVQEMAVKERRSLSDQAAYLIEKGLNALETGKTANGKPAA